MIAKLLARVLLVFALPFAAQAQSPSPAPLYVLGTLLDADTKQPLTIASIELLAAEGNVVRARTLTDVRGTFQLIAPAEGSYRLRTSRLDRDTLVYGPIEVTSGKPIVLELMARASPVKVAGLTISVAARTKLLTDEGFYERQRGGAGVYLTPEAIANLHVLQTPDLFHNVSGIRFVPQSGANDPVMMTIAGIVYEQTHPPRGRPGSPGMSDPRSCLPVIYLDGAMVQVGGTADSGDMQFNLATLPASQLLAVEVFRGPAEVPARFQAPMATCGVVVIWTVARAGGVSVPD